MANYLYNGIELPALPNWDKTLYPYVYITNGFLGIGRSYVCFQTIQYGENANGYYSLIIPAGTGMSGLYSDNQWSEPTVTTEDKSITIPNEAWIWANFDVLNEDGSVYLAATDPIPVPTITDPVSFTMGYQIGCRLRAQRAVKKPIGYLYGGVQLPKIPEVEGYEYMVIVEYNNSGIYTLYCMTNPLVRTGNVLYPNKVSAPYLVCNASVDGYGEFSQKDSDLSIAAAYVPIWTNVDIINVDGSVCLAASEPVPVYGGDS